ncbi:hypothetical protein ATANTOWER_029858 [Ataeniobius toweri]|uniref:Uncharacterized protein n=1 Tax=Ataeniobius toweri TaxID=208326 RepID=A0ABU7ATJ9_9TELE|nr:hypothetical protein [Ataeniobius toweri]
MGIKCPPRATTSAHLNPPENLRLDLNKKVEKQKPVLDHVLLNIGPFVRCWTPPGLPAPSAILYPRIVRYYKSQRAPRLIGRGRRRSDVTVDYVRGTGDAHHGFSRWKPRRGYHATGASLWRRNPTWTFIHSPPLANENKAHKRGTGNRKARSFQLYRSRTWI